MDTDLKISHVERTVILSSVEGSYFETVACQTTNLK